MAARPANERDILLATNGSPVWLGCIVSASGAVANNASPAPTAFSATPAGPPPGSVASPQNLQGTLAGKTLLLQPTAVGSVLPSTSPNLTPGSAPPPVVAQQAVVPPLAGTTPGVALNFAGERVIVVMGALEGWLQWLPLSGAGNLHVFELR